ncbi:YgaP family membrane protein [Hymenobacter armeniacus]|uniref:DUF2892 domain-containing protein n=1 Tax=Hymenobacter armeniacus TaxID=2771358 RepID=A0ABR8JP66_9BACT|nr:DUF2892 domain-containing protein [Hymenobacter armeniacus]MBD2721092.1 DUF2892 domain-containing protein [Hymenobacter armeniacus]
MRQNVGSLDRGLRILLAVIIVGVLLQQQRTGEPLLFWLVVATLLLGTGTFGYCPLYHLLGISTRRALPS